MNEWPAHSIMKSVFWLLLVSTSLFLLVYDVAQRVGAKQRKLRRGCSEKSGVATIKKSREKKECIAHEAAGKRGLRKDDVDVFRVCVRVKCRESASLCTLHPPFTRVGMRKVHSTWWMDGWSCVGVRAGNIIFRSTNVIVEGNLSVTRDLTANVGRAQDSVLSSSAYQGTLLLRPPWLR